MDGNWYIEKQTPYERHCHAFHETLFAGRTPYQEVRVVLSPVYGKMLILDDDIQSAQADEYIYHEVLVHPALAALPRPARRVLILGGGEGATLREVLKLRSLERVVMVDLDGDLVDICKEHMPEWAQGAFDDPRLELRHEDARAYLETCTESFDVVIHDLPQPLEESPLRLLFTRQCFELVKRVMPPDGLLCMQACSAKLFHNSLNLAIRRTVGEVFAHTSSLSAFIPFFATDWGYVLASASTDPLALGADEIDRRLGERLLSPLRYYRGRAHLSLLDMPPHYEEALARATDVFDDGLSLDDMDFRREQGTQSLPA